MREQTFPTRAHYRAAIVEHQAEDRGVRRRGVEQRGGPVVGSFSLEEMVWFRVEFDGEDECDNFDDLNFWNHYINQRALANDKTGFCAYVDYYKNIVYFHVELD